MRSRRFPTVSAQKRFAAGAAAVVLLIGAASCSSNTAGRTETPTEAPPAAQQERPPVSGSETVSPAAETEAAAVFVENDSTDAAVTEAAAAPIESAAAAASAAPGGGAAEQAVRDRGLMPPPPPEPAQKRAPEPPPSRGGITSRDAGVNPTEQTDADALSTFALDVDTSSYTLSRALVQQGTLPDFSSVRTEEFVNYFDQQYPSPKSGDTFAVHVDGAKAPFLADDQRIVRVGIQGQRVAAADRPRADLTFVIDVSGSMEEDGKLALVQDALRTLVNNLRTDDRVAIVAFSDDASVVLGPTSAVERSRILGAIGRLVPTNGTNAEAGLQLGYRIAEEMRSDQRGRDVISRVVLASDGIANVGPTGPEQILRTIRDSATRDIDLVTVGVGLGNYNDEMMERLADGGNGFSAYVDAPFEAERLFRERLVSSLQTIARDAKVQVHFDSSKVRSYRLLGFENRSIADSDFRNNAVDAGEIGAGHAVTALYEVRLAPGAERARSIGKVTLRWNDVRRGTFLERSEPIDSDRFAGSLTSADPRLGLDVTVAAYAEVLRRGPWARVTDLHQLAVQSRRLGEQLAGDPDVTEFVQLVDQAAQLSAQGR